jgi:saccharopine dehydrogenase-like NADP-dependent oxidoreductase
MTKVHHSVVVAGAGGIGRAVALLLSEWATFEVELWIGDARAEAAQDAAAWLALGAGKPLRVHPFHLPAEGVNDAFRAALEAGDILLDCLPGSEAPRLARLAREHDLHYANLTEYVAETAEVQQIATGASRGFLLQTGLAPGFINVLGHQLFLEFCRDHRVDKVDSLTMRVGALPLNALPPHYYAFTWSPIGVATEYVKDAIVVKGGVTTTTPSLTGVDTVQLGALRLEQAYTSGGAADLPQALAGRVDQLDYKTFRHPGHYAWVQGLLDALPSGADRIAALEGAMLEAVPAVEDDQVVLYAAAEGRDHRGVRQRKEQALVIPATTVGGHRLRAIQSTTAAGLAESARLLLEGNLSGVVLQSQIDPADYLAGTFIRRVYYGA